MSTEQLEINFSVRYAKKSFILQGGTSLPEEQLQYLKNYLAKASSYQVIGSFRSSPLLSLYQPPLTTPPGARSLAMRLKRRFDKQRIPATATLAINRACQCACEHCSAVFYIQNSKSELSTENLKRAIRETVDLGVTHIIFLGGEPLLRHDLMELVQAVPGDRAVTTLFTNGEFLTRKNCKDLAEAGLMGVFVSLDSNQAVEHDRLRHRPGLFAKATQGILNLQQAGILTAISSYLSPERVNDGCFEKIMGLGKELQVNEVTFFDAIPTGQWLHNHSCLLKPWDRHRIQTLVKHYRQQKGYPGISAQSTLTSINGSAFCFAATTQFYLSAQGEMCPCDFTPLSFGSFPEKNISTLWNRMIHAPPYHRRAKSCRMQDPEFRKRYLGLISKDSTLPVSILKSSEGTNV